MKPEKYLEVVEGEFCVSVSSEAVDRLGWGLGDEMFVDVEEVWMYDESSLRCVIRNLTKESFDRLMDRISGPKSHNSALNREDV